MLLHTIIVCFKYSNITYLKVTQISTDLLKIDLNPSKKLKSDKVNYQKETKRNSGRLI